jgi:flagellar hook-length control protein FliK
MSGRMSGAAATSSPGALAGTAGNAVTAGTAGAGGFAGAAGARANGDAAGNGGGAGQDISQFSDALAAAGRGPVRGPEQGAEQPGEAPTQPGRAVRDRDATGSASQTGSAGVAGKSANAAATLANVGTPPGNASRGATGAPSTNAAAAAAADAQDAQGAQDGPAVTNSPCANASQGDATVTGADASGTRPRGRAGRGNATDSSAPQGSANGTTLALLQIAAGATGATGAIAPGGTQIPTDTALAAASDDEYAACSVGSGSAGAGSAGSLMVAQQLAAADAAASGEAPTSTSSSSSTGTNASASGGSQNAADATAGSLNSPTSQHTLPGALVGLWAGGGDGTASGSPGANPTVTAGASRAGGGGSSNAVASGPALSPLLAQSLSAAGAAAASVTRGLAVPVTDPDWPRALAAQVQWMANAQLQSATLRLSPPHLGSLEVRIDVQSSQQINVTFSASHPDTRTALADAMPRLRELFTAGGLSLGQATVQQEAGSGASGSTGRSPARRAATLAVAQSVEPVALAAPSGLGLVDEYV